MSAPSSERAFEFAFSTRLRAPAREVWAHAIRLRGVNLRRRFG